MDVNLVLEVQDDIAVLFSFEEFQDCLLSVGTNILTNTMQSFLFTYLHCLPDLFFNLSNNPTRIKWYLIVGLTFISLTTSDFSYTMWKIYMPYIKNCVFITLSPFTCYYYSSFLTEREVSLHFYYKNINCIFLYLIFPIISCLKFVSL